MRRGLRPLSPPPSTLSGLVRDGALNEILRHLNRSTDTAGEAAVFERTEALLQTLHSLRRLLGAGLEPAAAEKRAALDAALKGPLSPQQRRALVESGELLSAVYRALGRPDHKLAAYGTLAPGGRNHARVAGLRGAWQPCFVRGRRWTAEDGDPAFLWNSAEPELAAMLLVSEDLPAAWPELDRFEGSPYRRHFVPVRAEDACHVAYLYDRQA